MDPKKFEEQLRAGEEVLKRAREVMDRVAADETRYEGIVRKQKEELENDPFLKKLREASTAVLDRVIERNKPAAKAQVVQKKKAVPSDPLKEAIRRARQDSKKATHRQIAEAVDRDLRARDIAFRAVCPPTWLRKATAESLSAALRSPKLNGAVKAFITKSSS